MGGGGGELDNRPVVGDCIPIVVSVRPVVGGCAPIVVVPELELGQSTNPPIHPMMTPIPVDVDVELEVVSVVGGGGS